MYTQCPECGSAFRVTAEVLKVAAGKVRCGSCANAFNALEYLSEEMPEQKSAAPDAEPQLPELKPEPEQQGDGLPESISAEQSAALLKTLDDLAGSDIRIEDTGVEWRLLDDDEDDNVDEVLEDSPTPVDEFLTRTPEVVDAPEIFEESANAPAQTPVEELRFDDNTPLPEDFGFEYPPVERVPIAEPEPEAEPEPAEPPPDITLSDPHEWTDILDEFEDLASEAARPLDAELDALLEEEEEAQADESAEALDDADEDLDDLLSDATDDDDSTRVDELVDEEPVDEDTSIEDLEFEDESDDSEADIDEEPVAEDEDDVPEDDFDEEDLEEDDFEEDHDDEEEELEDDEELDVVDEDPQLDLIQEPEVEEHDIEAELALIGDDEEEAHDAEVEADDEEDSGEHYVPPMSEEEQTVNMQIDQELFAIAVEDEDGFASTIVIPEDWSEEDVLESKGDEDSDETESDDDSESDDDLESASKDTQETDTGFETIIMEGAEVKSALDDEKRAADAAEAAELQAIAKAAEAEAASKSGSSRYGMIAGVVVLVLLLVVQIVHQSREALATNEVFNNTFGPIYRALGNPLQPSWDITGWQFEATRGSAEMEAEDNSTETNETLTVYSRIGNNSEGALPYPLIRISLIDRVMEPLGSHVLEPKDYLGENMDPRRLVEPGQSFEAAISVKLESEGVPNFQLHVCYRHSDHQLRCKDDNFK